MGKEVRGASRIAADGPLTTRNATAILRTRRASVVVSQERRWRVLDVVIVYGRGEVHRVEGATAGLRDCADGAADDIRVCRVGGRPSCAVPTANSSRASTVGVHAPA